MLYYEWLTMGGSRPRVLTLGEEWYCPQVKTSNSTAPGAAVAPIWKTSWKRSYACKAVHGHGYAKPAELSYADLPPEFVGEAPEAPANDSN